MEAVRIFIITERKEIYLKRTRISGGAISIAQGVALCKKK